MSTADRDFSEKRDFIRMTLNAQVQVHVQSMAKPVSGTCSDLSATGMSLLLTSAIAEGSDVRVVITSPNPQFASLDAKAKVIRCEALDTGDFRLGLEVISMS